MFISTLGFLCRPGSDLLPQVLEAGAQFLRRTTPAYCRALQAAEVFQQRHNFRIASFGQIERRLLVNVNHIGLDWYPAAQQRLDHPKVPIGRGQHQSSPPFVILDIDLDPVAVAQQHVHNVGMSPKRGQVQRCLRLGGGDRVDIDPGDCQQCLDDSIVSVECRPVQSRCLMVKLTGDVGVDPGNVRQKFDKAHVSLRRRPLQNVVVHVTPCPGVHNADVTVPVPVCDGTWNPVDDTLLLLNPFLRCEFVGFDIPTKPGDDGTVLHHEQEGFRTTRKRVGHGADVSPIRLQ